jgi:hypothetical protein
MKRLCSLCDAPITTGSKTGRCRTCSYEIAWQTNTIRGSKMLIEALRKAGYA